MSVEPLGLHHVTAIADDPQRNVDFYATVLGLRLVKQTVNFDSPDAYHLYYGDDLGSPATIMTFFSWPGMRPGRRGTGQASVTSFSVPERALGYWRQRLAGLGVETDAVSTRLEEDVLGFHDPDGLRIELCAHADAAERPPRERGPVPGEHAIRGLYAVTLSQETDESTARLLTETLGFRHVAEAGNRTRFDTGAGGAGARVDVVAEPEAGPGLVSVGTVHHVAWRAPDHSTQERWRAEIAGRGLSVTPIIDRTYFTSIYFREPGGVLLEIATDGPGFTVDEPVERLGTGLQLPPWLQDERAQIEDQLTPLRVPEPDAYGHR